MKRRALWLAARLADDPRYLISPAFGVGVALLIVGGGYTFASCWLIFGTCWHAGLTYELHGEDPNHRKGSNDG